MQNAAANFTFDFSLVKVEAPAEYRGLGESLSLWRKREAEEGPLHVVARKLGALFSDEVPPGPNLISAYGQRASQIARSPTVKPESRQQFGVFADYVGADGTSIWAAATSGSNALSVHLLACMLARMWSPSEAVSIWVELVIARKAILQKRIECEAFQFSELTAARIELSRDQLAKWDHSARCVL
jgi:hypothetical protein